jgi:hypothetical protein
MLESATLYKAVLFKILNRKTSYKDSSLTVKLQSNFKNVPVLAKLDFTGIDILTGIDRNLEVLKILRRALPATQ